MTPSLNHLHEQSTEQQERPESVVTMTELPEPQAKVASTCSLSSSSSSDSSSNNNNSHDGSNSHTATAVLRRRPLRVRTLSGGLPKRRVAPDEEEDEEEDGLEEIITTRRTLDWTRWEDSQARFTPPAIDSLVARVYVSSAPRRKNPRIVSRSPPPSRRPPPTKMDRYLLPQNHPFKLFWDVCTVFLSLANAYATHMAIRDREFQSPFIRFCEVWFVLDILLNFCVQRTTNDGTVLRTFRAVWARYLTSWFVIDVLSLFPAELLWVQPVVQAQKRRTFWQKGFFRTKAVVKVSRWLRMQHVRYLQRLSQHTKRAAGIGLSRLVRLLIRYAPKYLLFFRQTRGVLAVRLLRQFRVMRQMYRDCTTTTTTTTLKSNGDNATCNMTNEDDDEDLVTADWEVLDDGDPF